MPNHRLKNTVLADTAKQILIAAQEQDVPLRVLGGLGIYLACTEFQNVLDEFREPLSDIDLIGLSSDILLIEKVLASLGYEQDASWKMHFGYQRRIFYTPQEITIEIYLDKLYLCQEIDLRSRLTTNPPSLSPTDLFLSRIQRVKLASKDVLDLGVLLTAKGLGTGGPETIDLGYVTSLAATSWPWWKTMHSNLDFLLSDPPPALGLEPLRSRLLQLHDAIEREPKGLAWKMRALGGSRIQWYADVE
jgi:hypothetical protein